jgi:hypothetical protein
MFRRRLRRIVRAPFRSGDRHTHDSGTTTTQVATGTRGAQDIVDAARVRAQLIEQEAVDWAERLIQSAQQRAADIVASAEDRVEEMVARSSQLTRGYLREVFVLLDAGLAEERSDDQRNRWPAPPRRDHADGAYASLSGPEPDLGRREHDPPSELPARPNLGVVPTANEGT